MMRTSRTIIAFFAVFLAALALKLFVVDVMPVSGPSMRPTLSDGALIVEYKLAWGIPLPFQNRYLARWGKPRAGDIVVYPLNERYVVKRCVAPEGAPLAFSDETGYSVRVGERTIPLTREQYFKLRCAERVPEGMLFALGDNMAESRDSRDYGFVSIDSVRGKVLWR
jgi:signal peptidase I